ncbi:MAG TPA: hypothetical protein VGT60_06180 [Candidatus Limnocylindria bacterium]|nr:hypothetical protein [Candidatus Limnocylindria bacterium]
MTIEEWDPARIAPATGPAIGGTSRYRLEYRRRDEWTLILLSDDLGTMTAGQGNACRDGVYGSIAVGGAFRPTSRDPALCNGVPRWIRPGMACCYSWPKTVAKGLITYTSPGERVVFDAATGLPLTYEAGPVGGAVRHRTTYRLEQWLGCPAPCP